MPSPFQNGVLVGFVAGAAAMGLGLLLLRPATPPSEAPRGPSAAAGRETPLPPAELRKPEKPTEDPEKPGPAAAPTPAKAEPPSLEPAAKAQISELFGKLAEAGLAGLRSPKFGEALEVVKKEGKAAIDFLTNVLKSSGSATERFYAAALLEGTGDPTAIPGLAFALQNDKDDLVRRMASHGIAVVGSPAAEAPLRAAATGDADWGVRVNSAYGLAKLKNDDGLRMLREAYESPDTPPEYRIAVLGGLADVAAPSTAPLFRKILTDTKDVSYVLASISALEKMKDVESIPALQQLSTSSGSDIIKQAAAKAVDAIKK